MQAGLGFAGITLSDNGCIYAAALRGGYSVMESELFQVGFVRMPAASQGWS